VENVMKKNQPINSVRAIKILAVIGLGFYFQPLVNADVVVLQQGGVLTGTVLQQDGQGVLIQTETGTYRYPPSWVTDVKKEAAAAPHVSNNGKRIPDWAQIVSLLANNSWANGLKQVPATMIENGVWKNVPYVSFRCGSGGYEVNIYGDLNDPAAVRIGAMSYLSQDAGARSNCVNFICSVLASADARKMVRALNWNPDDVQKNEGMTFQTLQPGEPDSYGGWWVTVYNDTALANAQASETELLAITQPVAAAVPAMAAPQPAATAQPVAPPANAGAPPDNASAQQPAAPAQPADATATTTYAYGTTYYMHPAWTADEMANARPAAAAAHPEATAQTASASAAGKVYPRAYTRTSGSYGRVEERRR
jgi:hypothetical protein